MGFGFEDITKKISSSSLVDNLINIKNPFADDEKGADNTAGLLNKVLNNTTGTNLKYYSFPDTTEQFDQTYLVFYINKNTNDKNVYSKNTTKNENNDNLYSLNEPSRQSLLNAKGEDTGIIPSFVPTKTDTNIGGEEGKWIASTTGYTRIDKAISLFVPNDITNEISHAWSGEGTRSAQNVKDLMKGLGNILKSALPGGSSMVDTMGKEGGKLIERGGRVIEELMLGNAGKAFVGADKKNIANPRTEFLYASTEPRTFSYVFKLVPRSKKELDTIYQIIKLFKFHSYSGMNGSFLSYPSTFDVKFYTGGKENKNFINSSSCALTAITENLTGADGVYSVFEKSLNAGTEAPTAIVLTLSFMELEMITKNRFLELI